MRESVGSLKAYFIVIAVLSALGSVSVLGSASSNLVLLIAGIISLAFAAAYFYIGISLRKLLTESPKLIEMCLYINIAYQVFMFLLGLLRGFQVGSVIQLSIVLLIIWYLLVNVRRLSEEVRSKIGSE